MSACCCSLAGTRACLTCRNGSYYVMTIYPSFPVPHCTPFDRDPKPIDLDELAKKIAKLLGDAKKD